jgi:hypothetical protein
MLFGFCSQFLEREQNPDLLRNLANVPVLYQDDDMIYNLFSVVRCASPIDVIIPALYNTIQDLTRQKMNNWAADGDILFRDRCSALLFNPIMVAFWSDLVNMHGMKVKEAFARLLETGSFYSVFYDLLVTFMGAMQFSTLPIHDR